MNMRSDTRHQIDSMKEDLEQLRDEIRLKLHLGSMELRERFEEIEPDVRSFEHRATEVGHDVGDELKEGWKHLKGALTRIRDELRSVEA